MPNKCPSCGSFHVKYANIGRYIFEKSDKIQWFMRCTDCGEYYAKQPKHLK